MNGLANLLKSIGPTRLAIMGAAGLGVLLLLGVLTTRFGSPDFALLYGDLESSDAAQIVSKLDALGVPYELHGDGTQILVPRGDVPNLRLAMAQDGLPEGGSVGYELFDRTESFGASNLVQDINRLRALEGELARTIRTISSVHAARVHLVLPRNEIFRRDREEPSASIALQIKGSDGLSPAQVRAIRHLVAAAVPGLSAGRISIVDSRGVLLARGTDEGEEGDAIAANATEMQQAYEARMARSIEALIERSVGPGRVRVEVAADLDFDRVTERLETYDPDGQVVRSTQTVEEEATTND